MVIRGAGEKKPRYDDWFLTPSYPVASGRRRTTTKTTTTTTTTTKTAICNSYAINLSLAGAATSIISVISNTSLSRQWYACRDKTCVAMILMAASANDTEGAKWNQSIKLCFYFVATKLLSLSRQKFCRHKHTLSRQKTCFVATKDVFRRDKSKLVETKVLSRQIRVCRDKLSRQKLCRGKHTFVATKNVFCHDKNILVAAPANDFTMFYCVLIYL